MLSTSAHAPSERGMVIRPWVLLAVYATMPLAVILFALDRIVFEGHLRGAIGQLDPQRLALFTLLFTFPHILASFFGFFDAVYVRSYGAKLLRGAQLAVVAAVFLPLLNIRVAFLIFALFTMYHVFRQQSGIAKILMRGSNRWHAVWEWLGIGLSFALYVDIYTPLTISSSMYWVWFAGLLPFTFAGYKAVQASATNIGQQYFWLTHCLPILAGYLLHAGYPILSIAMPRIVHDLSGFVFYVTHDTNRFKATRSNVMYRMLNFTRLPVWLLSPIIAVLAAVLIRGLGEADLYLLLSTLFLLHYYNEGYMWKRGSLHRKYIQIAS